MKDSWFPVTGNIILRGNKPIASVPDNTEAYEIVHTLSQKNPRSQCTEEQASRVAWRIVKDWVFLVTGVKPGLF